MPDDLERKQDALDLGADADIVDDQRCPIRRQRIGDDPDVRQIRRNLPGHGVNRLVDNRTTAYRKRESRRRCRHHAQAARRHRERQSCDRQGHNSSSHQSGCARPRPDHREIVPAKGMQSNRSRASKGRMNTPEQTVEVPG